MAPHNNAGDSPDHKPKRPVTLRDIAQELGISHVTVSLALRNHARIAKATRERVKQKADEMGYHSDPMLSALSRYRQTSKEKPQQATLAWINPLKNPKELKEHAEFNLYWEGARATADKLGFQIEEFTTEAYSLDQMNTVFKSRGIRGLILAPITWETTVINWDDFPWHEYAGIRFGRSRQGPQMHLVTSAQASNTILAVETTLKKGYQRIGFVGSSTKRRQFSAGFLQAQQSLPKNRRLPLLLYDGPPTSLYRNLLKEWMEKEKPDAILTPNHFVPPLLQELGYSIPDEVGIATMSIHDTPINAGIDQSPAEIGCAAVRTLVSLLNEHHFGVPEIRTQNLVEGQWVDGSMLPSRV